MAVITAPARTRTTEHSPAGPRLARAGLAALLLALGVGRPSRHTGQRRSAKAAARLTAKVLLLTLYHRISEDRVMAIAAGVTFYALLALFPAIAAMVSIYGLFADLKTINADLSSLASILPGGAIEVVGDQIKRLVANGSKTLGFAALAGTAISIWSANAGVKAMFDALNIVLKEEEKRGFIRLNLTSLAFTVGSLVVVLLAVGFVLGAPLALKYVGLNGQLDWLIDIGRWPLLWAGLALAIALLYRFGPTRNDIPWRWISWGSALASFIWLIASMAFSWYAANFGTYNRTYGSLGAVIGFMTWIWISAIIVLVGEELNVTLDKLRHPHKHRAKPHPLGVGRKPEMARAQ
ncbi:MAG TPA: YihY/virulence factor BrkB family protein [Rhizomicrobium sp.]|jgi:membrane protein|nr:YihY/virulence factor BrkB family protein [Rhizomicrobium sp.]